MSRLGPSGRVESMCVAPQDARPSTLRAFGPGLLVASCVIAISAAICSACERHPSATAVEHPCSVASESAPRTPSGSSSVPASVEVDNGSWLGSSWMRLDPDLAEDALLGSVLLSLVERPDLPTRIVAAFQPESILRTARVAIARAREATVPEDAERAIASMSVTPNIVVVALAEGVPRPTRDQFRLVLRSLQSESEPSATRAAIGESEARLRQIVAELDADIPVSVAGEGRPVTVCVSDWQVTTCIRCVTRIAEVVERTFVIRTLLRCDGGEVRLVCSTVSCSASEWRVSLEECLRAHQRLARCDLSPANP